MIAILPTLDKRSLTFSSRNVMHTQNKLVPGMAKKSKWIIVVLMCACEQAAENSIRRTG